MTWNRLYQEWTPRSGRPLGQDRLHNLLARLGVERRINYHLGRFQSALEAVGHPEKNVYSLVITGTNGKGSTSLNLSSVLTHAGFKVGTYLSPHLQHPSERFLIDLVPIDPLELTELAVEHFAIAEQFQLSYFEFLTLLNFVRAVRESIDFLVLEVGLGGRLDATNVTRPLAAAITNVDLDHQAYLGNTREAILRDKLGILRPEGLFFTGITDPALLAIVEETCLAQDAIYYYSKELRVGDRKVSWKGQTFTLNGHPLETSNPSVGSVQNAALATLMIRILFPKLSLSTIGEGIKRVLTPGRMEVVQDRPRVVLSGDHNPAGIRCLKETLQSLPSSRIITIAAFSPDKPAREMIGELKTFSEELWLTQISQFASSTPPEYSTLGNYRPDPRRLVEAIVERADPSDTVLVTGSLYLVGEVRSLWQNRVQYLESISSPLSPLSGPWGASNRAKAPPRALRRTLSP
jgi:dihydrofolate synthase / folylpolyglutamate synthase